MAQRRLTPSSVLAIIAAALLGSSLLAGCAHHPDTDGKPVAVVEPAAEIPFVVTPLTEQDARRTLELAFAAVDVGDDELAAGHFLAVLASDYLTDLGRMNVYWQCAESHRRLFEFAGERDALEGFLLSAQLVTLSKLDAERAALALSVLTASKNHRSAALQAGVASLRTPHVSR